VALLLSDRRDGAARLDDPRDDTALLNDRRDDAALLNDCRDDAALLAVAFVNAVDAVDLALLERRPDVADLTLGAMDTKFQFERAFRAILGLGIFYSPPP
jgi:hypothetical protein